MYRIFAALYPRKIRMAYFDLIVYSNIKIDKTKFVSYLFLYNIAFSALIAAIFRSVLLFFGLFIAFHIIIYFWLLVYSDKKAKFIEDVLPDALLLMSTNLRSGFTTDRALLLAARPEFGPLKDELNIVGRQITAGMPIENALQGIMKRVRSEKLVKTLNLIISGIRSGGELAELLQQTASDLKNQSLVDKKVRSSVFMYVIFIFIATMFGAPLLFAMSTFLVETVYNTLKNVDIPANVAASYSLPVAFNTASLEPSFVINFVIAMLITSSIFGSFTMGLINKGREREGIKYIPVLLVGSIAFYFIIRAGIKVLLAGLFSGP